MFFSGWDSLFRTLVVGVLAYIALVVFLRISGKRTLSKMNDVDLVVTVALGSTLATILLAKDMALAEGLLAFALLTTKFIGLMQKKSGQVIYLNQCVKAITRFKSPARHISLMCIN